jgi:hypothetical protein
MSFIKTEKQKDNRHPSFIALHLLILFVRMYRISLCHLVDDYMGCPLSHGEIPAAALFFFIASQAEIEKVL